MDKLEILEEENVLEQKHVTSLYHKNDSDFETFPEINNDSCDEAEDCMKIEVEEQEHDYWPDGPGPSGMQLSAASQ